MVSEPSACPDVRAPGVAGQFRFERNLAQRWPRSREAVHKGGGRGALWEQHWVILSLRYT